MFTFHPILGFIVHPYQLLEGMYFFLLVIAAIIVFISMYLLRRGRKTARRQQLREEFSDFISELAICETEEECKVLMAEPAQLVRMDGWLKDPFARRTLIRELVTTVKSMSGQSATNICWFYATTGLHQDSLMRLKSKHWHVKGRAIQQLSHLQQQQYITKIYRLANDPHELVRNEARIAVVKLTGFEGLRFLDVITYPITDWQQICLLQELSQHRKIVFPAMHRLLQSTNKSVVEFTLRLIATYQVYDLHNEVVACLSSASSAVREKAIYALKEIAAPETPDVLVAHFDEEEIRLQVLILEVLKDMGTSTQLPFLFTLLDHSDNDVKAAAARVIRNIDANGISLIENRVDSAHYPWSQLIPQLRQEVAA